MRPVPRRRHLLAALIFVACAALASGFAMLDDRLSKTQANIATVAIKRPNQDYLFKNDPVFGKSDLWRFHTPLYQALMEMVLVPTGYEDLTLPFRAMTGLVVLVYLAGMYVLLYRQCRSWSVAALVAVLSSAVTYTLGRSFWGVGSLSSITPPTLVMAMTPLIVLSYLRYQNQWRVLLVFAFIGLCANLHMVTALNLALVLVIVYLGCRRFAPSSWPTAIACALATLVVAFPYMGYYLHLRISMTPQGARVSAAVVNEAFRLGHLALLYPEMLKSLLYWVLLVLVLLIPAAAVLSRVERFRVRDLGVWVWLICGAFFVSLVLHGASQLLGVLLDRPPPIIDFARASNLVMLPLYVLFAQALTNLFRLVRGHRDVLRWGCALFLAAWMLPSDNLRVGRHIVYEAATAFMADDRKPLRVQQLARKRRQRAELTEIARWARQNTPAEAMFLTDRMEFRMMSRRSILACSDDVSYYYYVTPWRLGEWIDHLVRQKAVLSAPDGKSDGRTVAKFVADLRAEGFEEVPGWYVILRAANAPETPEQLLPIKGGNWGVHYRLYRVR